MNSSARAVLKLQDIMCRSLRKGNAASAKPAVARLRHYIHLRHSGKPAPCLQISRFAAFWCSRPSRRNDTGEDNADAHIKRHALSREDRLAVTEGRPGFVTCEQIFYGEFDGRGRKHVLVKSIGDKRVDLYASALCA